MVTVETGYSDVQANSLSLISVTEKEQQEHKRVLLQF